MNQCRTFITFQVVFALICTIVLFFVKISIGIQLLLLVLLYNISLLVIAFIQNRQDWLKIYAFILPLSLFQILPVLVLTDYLKTITFPTDFLLPTGSVAIYMPLLWVIPFFIIICMGDAFAEKINFLTDIIGQSKRLLTDIFVALVTCVIFSIAEQTMWQLPSWDFQHVKMIGHVPIHAILAETILGVMVYTGHKLVKNRNFFLKIVAAFVVMLNYLGALLFFYFIIDN